MSSASGMPAPTVSQLMEAMRNHPRSSHSLVRYPTATYSVHTGKISFAPGTKFNRKLESRVSGRARTTTMNIRPLKEGEKPVMPKFKLPKATSPALPGSVICSGFLDQKKCPEHVQFPDDPSRLQRSRSSGTLSELGLQSHALSTTASTLDVNESDNVVNNDNDVENINSSSKSLNVIPSSTESCNSALIQNGKYKYSLRMSEQARRPVSGPTSGLPGMPNFKPWADEDMNACRPIYHGVHQHVERNQKCQGRNVRFSNADNVAVIEPDFAVRYRGFIQRVHARNYACASGAKQKGRIRHGYSQNGSVDDISRHLGRMYEIQTKLKPV